MVLETALLPDTQSSFALLPQLVGESIHSISLGQRPSVSQKPRPVPSVPALPPLVSSTGPFVALTFDDGPGPHTERLLDALAARNVSVTFYVLGSQVNRHPDIAARIAAEGHELGNHTQNHRELPRQGAATIRNEITLARNAIYAATGQRPATLRPPYGAHNGTVRNIAREMGYPIILWSIDTRDWERRNVQAILSHMFDRTGRPTVRCGDIILMHDIHSTTVDAAIITVDRLLNAGYTFVTVSELLELRHGNVSPGQIYTHARR